MKRDKAKVSKANYRCPKCRAKMKISSALTRTYTCNRCGYFKAEIEDNRTRKFIWG